MNEQKNLDLAYELKNEVSKWVDGFNYIQIHVLDKMCDNTVYEYIRSEEPDYQEFIRNYGLHSEFKKATEEEAEQADEETLRDFCEGEPSWDNFECEQRDANYPMWNTCFEFKEDPSEEILQSAVDAGFGIIEGLDEFNPLLFVSGCGYSFYGAHWMPLYLALPWNEDTRKKYKGVKFDMM